MLLTEYDYDTDIAVQRQEAYEDGVEQGISQGIQQGEYKAKIETAKNLLAMGLSIENICKATDLSIEEVNLISNNTKQNLVEQTKLNEIFKGEYMAWGLAEFDAEQRGKKEGYSAGVFDGIKQGI